MINKIGILFVLCFSIIFLCHAQDKKSTKRMEEQVRIAKEQQAALKHAQVKENEPNKQPFTIPGSVLVPLKITTRAGAIMTQDDLPKGQPLMLVLFNPMCDHCQKVATTLQEHIDVFKDITVVFLTGLNLINEVQNFITASGIIEGRTIILGGTDMELSSKIFMSKGIPQMMLYNKDHILQHTFFETLNIDSTLHYLKK